MFAIFIYHIDTGMRYVDRLSLDINAGKPLGLSREKEWG
jgi:hypothetical protein